MLIGRNSDAWLLGARTSKIGKKLNVVTLGRKGCHLCEVVEAELKSMEGTEISITVVDIDRDPALHAKYVLRIPVVSVGGEDVFEAAMMDTEGKWKELLRSLMKASQGRQG